jgi:hypothetical protein
MELTAGVGEALAALRLPLAAGRVLLGSSLACIWSGALQVSSGDTARLSLLYPYCLPQSPAPACSTLGSGGSTPRRGAPTPSRSTCAAPT